MNGRDDAEVAEDAQGSDFLAWVRAWRYLFWLLGIAVGIALFYGIENWRGQAAWEKYRRDMAARGEPIELSAVIPPEVDDADNFAMTPFLATRFNFQPAAQQAQVGAGLGAAQEFAARFDAAAREVKQPKETGSLRLNSWARERTDLFAWYRAFQQLTNPAAQDALTASRRRYGQSRPGAGPGRPMGSGQSRGTAGTPSVDGEPRGPASITLREAASGVLAGLEDCGPALDELRSASQRARCRFKIDYAAACPAAILLPHLAALKHLSIVLQLRASAELALGRTEEAFNDVMLMLYLADACRDEPILISHLVRIAQFGLAIQPLAEGLAGHQWSEAQLRMLQDRLSRLDLCADARRVLLGECLLFGCGTIDYIHRSPGELPRLMDSGPSTGLAQALMRVAPSGWFCLEKRNLCRAFAEALLSAFDVPGRQVHPSAGVQQDEEAHSQTAVSGTSIASEPPLFLSGFCSRGRRHGAENGLCADRRGPRGSGLRPRSLAVGARPVSGNSRRAGAGVFGSASARRHQWSALEVPSDQRGPVCPLFRRMESDG
ncbi:MAG: hypothetical protein ACLQVX_21520 [Limisphaerales bacterium]